MLRYANAGHNLPYLRTASGLVELRARGMPLGLMPGMPYEEKEVDLCARRYRCCSPATGWSKRTTPQREMFGFPRLKELMAGHERGEDLIESPDAGPDRLHRARLGTGR